jgi:hypothetical protein
MALSEYYLVTTKNLDSFLNALTNAQAPPKFTNKFLEQLEFKSTNDRLFIGMLKGLSFIDQNGVPQEKYYQFIDQTQSRKVLAEAIREGYSDLFAINLKANEMSTTEVKNKLKTLTQGTKTDHVLGLMANTFHALCKYADFSSLNNPPMITKKKDEPEVEDLGRDSNQPKMTHELVNKKITTEMHYNIQIHLPETRDITVYDAIFKSMKKHLL